MQAFLTCAAILCSAVACAADEWGPPVQLLRPDSLLGWEHGAAPRGWMIKDGVLTGEKHATKLVSGWTLGDAEFSLEWKAERGATLELILETPDAAQRLELTADGAMVQSSTPSSGGSGGAKGFLNAARDFVKITIRRQGKSLAYEVKQGDFGTGGSSSVGVAGPALLALQVAGGKASLRNLTLRVPAGKAIFNEKDLTGWWTPGKLAAWHAENGELVKRGGGGNYLRTEKEYGNFVLAFEYLIGKGGNSGVGIRTARNAWPSAEGMELQLQDRPGLDKHSTMAIYGNAPPVARADRSEVWNQAVVRAEGPMISGWINGELVQQTHTGRHPELKHRPRAGWIGWQDHGGVDRFRNIRVLELPEGDGPAAWHAPPPPDAVRLVLNPLLNSEQLAERDPIAAKFVTTRATGGGVETLAELAGPGVLVGVASTTKAGHVSFYFDGEAEPRLKCRTDALHKKLPAASETEGPLLTFVPFAKSLKIELRDGLPGDFAFEYVQTPRDLPLPEFTGVDTLPAAWDATLEYRRHQQKHGNLRKQDGYPKAASPVSTLAPGAQQPLLALEGAGVVEWLELAGRTVSDDLWLEIHVDGAEPPAIFAPARALFAPIRDGQGHPSYVLLADNHSVVLRWAMPYTRGLKITAHNRGPSPLANVAATACIHPAEPAATKTLRRLHADYQTGPAAAELHLAGPGRLVGLVCEQASADAVNQLAVTDLTLDDQPQPAWQNLPVELWLGRASRNDFRSELTGRVGGLSWRNFLLAPLDYQKSLTLQLKAPELRSRLALYYQ